MRKAYVFLFVVNIGFIVGLVFNLTGGKSLESVLAMGLFLNRSLAISFGVLIKKMKFENVSELKKHILKMFGLIGVVNAILISLFFLL